METSINVDVTISKFSYEEYGGHGDVSYDIEFTINKALKFRTTKEMKITAYSKTVPRSTPVSSKNRTILGYGTLDLSRDGIGDSIVI